MQDKKDIKLGDGVADALKLKTNQELSDIGKLIIGEFAKFVKGKIQDIDFDKLFSKKNQEEFVEVLSTQLAKKGVIPKGYSGLPEELLIDNLLQDGYLQGLYVGYALSIMALVDNEASKDLIIATRDVVRQNLMGHHYNESDEFINKFKDEKYNWVNSAKQE